MFNTELEDKIGGFWDGYDKENLPLISQLMKEAGKFLFWKKKTKFKKKTQQVYTYCVSGSVFHVNLIPTLQHEDKRQEKEAWRWEWLCPGQTLNCHNTVPNFQNPDSGLGQLRADRQWTVDPKIPPCESIQELPQAPGHVPAWNELGWGGYSQGHQDDCPSTLKVVYEDTKQ